MILGSLTRLSRAFAGQGLLSRSCRSCTKASFIRHYRYAYYQPVVVPVGLPSPRILCIQTRLKSSEVDSGGVYMDATDGDASWETEDDTEFDLNAEPTDAYDDEFNDVEEEEDETNELLEEYSAWSTALEKALKSMERKENSLQSELKKAEDVEKTVFRGQLIVSNLYLFTMPSIKTVTVQDWENDGQEMELTLDAQYDSASAEADALFAQARKLKRGSQVIADLLVETESSLQLLRDAQLDFTACLTDGEEIEEGMFQLIQDRLQRTSKKTKFAAPSFEPTQNNSRKKPNSKKQQQPQQRSIVETSVRKMKSPGGCDVWVGRNRRGNEYLSFHVARGNDIWMHARGSPGAHIILHNRRGSPQPTDECLDFCANVAIFYSDARTERKASVTAADSKHILKPRGAPLGAVKVREELYTLTGWPHKVPDELKLARDECGQTDEFRAKDKAKHKKRTKEVAKQVQAKRKTEQKSNKRKTKRQPSSESEDPFDFY